MPQPPHQAPSAPFHLNGRGPGEGDLHATGLNRWCLLHLRPCCSCRVCAAVFYAARLENFSGAETPRRWSFWIRRVRLNRHDQRRLPTSGQCYGAAGSCLHWLLPAVCDQEEPGSLVENARNAGKAVAVWLPQQLVGAYSWHETAASCNRTAQGS